MSAGLQLDVEELEHKFEMANRVGVPPVELSIHYAQLGEVHDVGEVGAHRASDHEQRGTRGDEMPCPISHHGVVEIPHMRPS